MKKHTFFSKKQARLLEELRPKHIPCQEFFMKQSWCRLSDGKREQQRRWWKQFFIECERLPKQDKM